MRSLKKIITLVILTCIFRFANAQTYNTGIGIRFGGQTSGITFRHFMNSDGALEGIASFGHKSFIITGLYEKFKPINNAPGLQWFYGGGAHIGFFSYGGHYNRYKDNGNYYYYVEEEGSNAVVPGLDFIIGMDYKFNNAPINIGLDLKPFIDFDDGLRGYWDGAFSFRFVFKEFYIFIIFLNFDCLSNSHHPYLNLSLKKCYSGNFDILRKEASEYSEYISELTNILIINNYKFI